MRQITKEDIEIVINLRSEVCDDLVQFCEIRMLTQLQNVKAKIDAGDYDIDTELLLIQQYMNLQHIISAQKITQNSVDKLKASWYGLKRFFKLKSHRQED